MRLDDDGEIANAWVLYACTPGEQLQASTSRMLDSSAISSNSIFGLVHEEDVVCTETLYLLEWSDRSVDKTRCLGSLWPEMTEI
jgi:hypothetical protein